MAENISESIISRKDFKYGVVDSIEDVSIPPGAASRSLGWLTLGDRIELVRGRRLMGSEVMGSGRVSGVGVGFKPDGTQVLFKTYGKKILYYDEVTSDWIEVGSDKLGSGVVTADDPYGEDISITPYSNLAGAQIWLSSPNSSLFKIMVTNPGTANDQYDATKNFKGYIKAKNGRMWLWNRGSSGTGSVTDPTGLYGSYIDKDEVSDFSNTTGESIGGSGSQTYAGTLVAVTGKKTCFGVTITESGGEVFTDDKNGILIGSAGGTGTINYATGAYSITFNAVTAGAVTASYYTEDSTSAGIADFTKSAPRTAGQGFVLRQDDAGGPFRNLLAYNSDYYCMHDLKTWLLTLSADDLTATNKIYREKVGTPSFRGPIETGKGIYYIDDTDKNQPRIRLLTLDSNLAQVVPVPISNNLNLMGYMFDRCAGLEWGDYLIWFCRTSDSPVNNRILALHKIWGSFDPLPFCGSCGDVYNGVLLCGDSLSSNVYELFSGLDDDESTIENFWEGGLENLDREGMKKVKKFVLEGDIGPDQSYRVYISVDHGPFVEVGVGAVSDLFPTGQPAIYGAGAYVDRSQRVLVGSLTLGRGELGGGSMLVGDVEAYHYKRQFSLGLDRLERAKVRYVAQGIGYASISMQQWKDVRHKNFKIPNRYR